MNTEFHDPICITAQQLIATTLDPIDINQPLDDHGIHRLRLCTKKLRALLQLYRPLYSRDAIAPVEARIKTVADTLSGSRDAHVLHKALCNLADSIAHKHRPALAPLIDYFAQRCTTSRGALPELHLQATFTAILDDWRAIPATSDTLEISDGLAYSYARARKLSRVAIASGEVARYHACRKWLKYYLYQLKLTDIGRRKALKKHRRKAARLADLLGELHDLSVLAVTLEALAGTAAMSEDALEQGRALALRQCRKKLKRSLKHCKKRVQRFFARKHSPAVK